MSACLLHMDRPATYVSVRLGQPMWLWLCSADIAIWKARGLEVTTPSAIAESDVSLPPADGARPAIAEAAAAALNGDGDIEHRVAG